MQPACHHVCQRQRTCVCACVDCLIKGMDPCMRTRVFVNANQQTHTSARVWLCDAVSVCMRTCMCEHACARLHACARSRFLNCFWTHRRVCFLFVFWDKTCVYGARSRLRVRARLWNYVCARVHICTVCVCNGVYMHVSCTGCVHMRVQTTHHITPCMNIRSCT